MFDTDRLAQALKAKRDDMTMREAVKASGIPYSSYNRMERGVGTPSIENLMRACAWLDRSMDDFRSSPQGEAA